MSTNTFLIELLVWRRRMGIEPTVPPLARSTIGFEDRGWHQSSTRFRAQNHTAFRDRQAARNVSTSPRAGAGDKPVHYRRMRSQGSCHCGAVRFAFDADAITE